MTYRPGHAGVPTVASEATAMIEHTYAISLRLPEDVAAALIYEAQRLGTTVQTVAQGWMLAGATSSRILVCGAREN